MFPDMQSVSLSIEDIWFTYLYAFYIYYWDGVFLFPAKGQSATGEEAGEGSEDWLWESHEELPEENETVLPDRKGEKEKGLH